jgi:hypothetical protein
MVIAARKPINSIRECPHCGSNVVFWDGLEKEPYCCICGWRRAIQITAEQAKNRFTCERKFWINLFASDKDPDDPLPTIK